MNIRKITGTSRLVSIVPLVLAACSSARSDGLPEATKTAGVSGPQPDLGPLVQQKEPPPPISGGTLAVAARGAIAVAADPDRDRVYVVDVPMRSVRHAVELPPKSEPGRVALDGSGRAHVALRNAGAVATIELESGKVSIRSACAAPRGIAFDARKDLLYVACATGDLVVLPAAGGEVVTRVTIGRDLRDVVLSRGRIHLTKFRSAHLLTIGADGRTEVDAPLDGSNLAWRAVAAPAAPGAGGDPLDAGAPEAPSPDEGEAIVTQEPSMEPVSPEPGGYGGGGGGLDIGCGSVGIVTTKVWLRSGETTVAARLPQAVLPVDLATNGREIVVVAAGNAFTEGLPQIFLLHRDQLTDPSLVPMMLACGNVSGNVPGQAIAAAFDDRDELIVQTREPAALHVMTPDRRRPWKTIPLSAESKEDTGHRVFHANAGGNIACASCHAEGADDGVTWEFVGMGPRRTPSLLGTTPNTEPFHWAGDMKDLSTLVEHVFVERMSGPKLDKDQVGALGNFLFKLPAPVKLREAKDVSPRGKELFDQRCASCHEGAILTNNRTVDVGTGGAFQVPSLVGVGWRAPYLHTGCAKTLFDRFDPGCGGAGHGDTRDLGKEQIADLVGFLETL